MAENIKSNVVKNHGESTTVENYISQIHAGGQTYDIATHHGITFRDGNGDATGVTWNGLTDLEIVIPSITDIVQTPIEFAGTVTDGVISWNEEGHTLEIGNLVFITNDCEFEGAACEAGDMAIYDGSKWNIVSGENQVSIVGSMDDDNRATIKVGAAQDVLTVEGKKLALTLDYTEINKHISKAPGGNAEPVVFGDMTVGSTYIKLKQEDEGEKITIGDSVKIDIATKLASDEVTLTNATGLVNNIVWGTFTEGTLPQFDTNSEKKLDIAGGVLTKKDGSDFVTNVTLDAVTFVDADANDENKIEVVTCVSSAEGTSFLTNIDGATSFTIEGYIAPQTGVSATFVTGLEGNINPVTSITEGSFTLVSGNDLVTGLVDPAEGAEGDVVSSVSVSYNNETSVLNSATVSNNVLYFGSTNVTSGVTVSTTSKAFAKTGYSYVAPTVSTTAFTTGGFVKVSDTTHTFGTAKETTYTATSKMWKLNTPALGVSTGSYEINHDNMKATVSAGMFVASATSGTYPTWTGMSFNTVDVTGTISTALETTTKTINAVAASATEITLPGDYSIVAGAAGDGVSVEVGKAGELAATNATVNLSAYTKDFAIVETVVSE